MKKVVDKKTYNTDTATAVATQCTGTFGDPNGYEETLYQTRKGDYFLYGKGGEKSPYVGENIRPITSAEATQWVKKQKVAVPAV